MLACAFFNVHSLAIMPSRFQLTQNDFDLPPNTVHIWHMKTLSPPALLDQYAAVLSPQERDKFARLKQELHQQRQIEAQAKMRIILSRYLDCAPVDLSFDRMSHGKPFLASEPVRFNLTHSGDQGLLAVSSDIELGIDLECWRGGRNYEELVVRFFSRLEIEAWQRLPEDVREVAFFNQWTRKEAFMKATGRGLGLGLGNCSFSWQAPSRLLECPEEYGSPDHWRLYSIDVGERASASLIVQSDSCRLMQGLWDDRWLNPG